MSRLTKFLVALACLALALLMIAVRFSLPRTSLEEAEEPRRMLVLLMAAAFFASLLAAGGMAYLSCRMVVPEGEIWFYVGDDEAPSWTGMYFAEGVHMLSPFHGEPIRIPKVSREIVFANEFAPEDGTTKRVKIVMRVSGPGTRTLQRETLLTYVGHFKGKTGKDVLAEADRTFNEALQLALESGPTVPQGLRPFSAMVSALSTVERLGLDVDYQASSVTESVINK